MLGMLALAGRFGDSAIREVDGEFAHVNEEEANLIDTLGSLGENITKQIGAGTTNPETGLKEYFWPMIALAGAGMYANWRGAHEATKGLDKNLEKVAGYMEPYKTAIDKYEGMSEEYMDSTSGMNQQLLNQYQQSGMDFSTAQNRMGARNLSSGGMGGFSGLQNAINQSSMMKAQNQAMDTWKQNLLSNRQTGLSLMDKYVQGQKGYGETMAQGWLQNDQLRRQATQAQWGGLGEGLLGIAGGMEWG